jgi:hypothetical protein
VRAVLMQGYATASKTSSRRTKWPITDRQYAAAHKFVADGITPLIDDAFVVRERIIATAGLMTIFTSIRTVGRIAAHQDLRAGPAARAVVMASGDHPPGAAARAGLTRRVAASRRSSARWWGC